MNKNRLRLSYLFLLGAALIEVGCSSGYAPVNERSTRLSHSVEIIDKQRKASATPRGSSYRVKRGDTLYSIAWNYGVDYRSLARRNKIGSGYRIYVGQRLYLDNLTAFSSPAATRSVTPVSKVGSASSQNGPKKTATSKQSRPEVTTAPAMPQKETAPQSESVTPAPKKKSPQKPTPRKQLPVPAANIGIQWRWPAAGKIIGTFSASGRVNKGINISGRRGAPVKAAADGKVVYAGNGLLGYGYLIILHHNQEYLSAYAHNSRILVKENDIVKGGEKIAEIGSSGAARNMLHFEIRKDGKPVNPVKYLPVKRTGS